MRRMFEGGSSDSLRGAPCRLPCLDESAVREGLGRVTPFDREGAYRTNCGCPSLRVVSGVPGDRCSSRVEKSAVSAARPKPLMSSRSAVSSNATPSIPPIGTNRPNVALNAIGSGSAVARIGASAKVLRIVGIHRPGTCAVALRENADSRGDRDVRYEADIYAAHLGSPCNSLPVSKEFDTMRRPPSARQPRRPRCDHIWRGAGP